MPTSSPRFGLVCVTDSERCRYRALTRTRLLQLPADDQVRVLRDLYWANLARLHNAISFCASRDIQLYRVTSDLFPFSDDTIGERILRNDMPANLSAVGRRLKRLGIRMVVHPDQFVVLSSESDAVVRNSIRVLERHALAFDLFGLQRSPWNTILIHGGKSGRADALVQTIATLPASVRSRLALENDEYAYSADEILAVCRRAGVPMVFDNHHHAIHEKLKSYDHPSLRRLVRAARDTWPRPAWQIVHLSNGREFFLDPRHSDLISHVPAAFAKVPWVEVEAKGKERAIDQLLAALR